MLNYLSVFQLLSLKVKLDKIDPYYPFHPDSDVDLKNDTRIKSDTKQLEDWIKNLRKFYLFSGIYDCFIIK